MKRRSGFTGFSILWSGQVISAVGTRMTNFAVSIWVWDHTGSAADMSLLMFSSFAATVAFSPLAGALIDRLARRLTIMISDIGSAVVTAGLLLLYMANSVHIWELYVVNVLTGMFLAFQAPAYRATISQIMERSQYVRANAMMGLVIAMPDVFAPVLSAVILAASGIRTVLEIDTASYVVAILMVFLVAFPPAPDRPADDSQGFFRDVMVGFRYIKQRPSLVGLSAIIFMVSFLSMFGWVLLSPFVLAVSHGSARQLGVVLTVGAIGGTAGGIVLTALPQTQRKVTWMLTSVLVFSILGRIWLGVSHSVVIWAASLFIGWAAIPFIDGYNQAIWQEKVESAVLGRVFAVGQMIEYLGIVVALGIAGPLADDYFGPAMRPGGSLAGILGPIVGTGPGAGIAAMYVLSGVLGAVVGITGFALPTVRNTESLLSDATSENQREPDKVTNRGNKANRARQ